MSFFNFIYILLFICSLFFKTVISSFLLRGAHVPKVGSSKGKEHSSESQFLAKSSQRCIWFRYVSKVSETISNPFRTTLVGRHICSSSTHHLDLKPQLQGISSNSQPFNMVHLRIPRRTSQLALGFWVPHITAIGLTLLTLGEVVGQVG